MRPAWRTNAPTAAAPSPSLPPPRAPRQEAAARLAIVYGSQTGNGKRIAERLARAAEAAGLAVRVSAAGQYPIKDLAKERMLVVVMSTHGDGDPPDDARSFIEFIGSKRAPKLEQLSYSVLALGDSSYPRYCETGRQVDERLAALGARRIVERADADVDFERIANPWLEKVVAEARESLGAPQVATVTRLRTVPAAPLYSREQPFAAEIIDNQRITGRAATKDVRHVEFSLAGSGLRYEPGDALGVWHENPREIVDGVLGAVHASGDEKVESDGETRSLREWLSTAREITRLTKPFLLQHAELAKDAGAGCGARTGPAGLAAPHAQGPAAGRRAAAPSRAVGAGEARVGAAPARAAAVFDRLEPGSGRRRGAPDRRGRSTTNSAASAASAPRRRSSPGSPAPTPAPGCSSNRTSASACRPTPRAT